PGHPLPMVDDPNEERPCLPLGQTHTEHQTHKVSVRLRAGHGSLRKEPFELRIVEDAIEHVITDELPGGIALWMSTGMWGGVHRHRHGTTRNMLTPRGRR